MNILKLIIGEMSHLFFHPNRKAARTGPPYQPLLRAEIWEEVIIGEYILTWKTICSVRFQLRVVHKIKSVAHQSALNSAVHLHTSLSKVMFFKKERKL